MEQKQAKEIEQLKKDLEEAKKETLIAYADRQTSIRIAKEDVRKAKVTFYQNNNITIKFLVFIPLNLGIRNPKVCSQLV